MIGCIARSCGGDLDREMAARCSCSNRSSLRMIQHVSRGIMLATEIEKQQSRKHQ